MYTESSGVKRSPWCCGYIVGMWCKTGVVGVGGYSTLHRYFKEWVARNVELEHDQEFILKEFIMHYANDK